MTVNEVKEFLKKVKAHYQEFKIDEAYIVKEWIEQLCPYAKDDIYEKFKEHLENETVQKEVPKIQVLIKWLVPEKDKAKRKGPIKGLFYCRWCKEKFKSTEYLAYHEERCLRLRYIRRMCDKLLIDPRPFFGTNFNKCSLEELDANYDAFILKIIEVEKQKQILNAFEKDGIRAYYNNVIKRKDVKQ